MSTLRDEAPEQVQRMLDHAEADPETYYVVPWPPQDSAPILYRNRGPQTGWSIGTERWCITVWKSGHNEYPWLCGGDDDEGNQWRTDNMGAALAWLVTDPKGVPT